MTFRGSNFNDFPEHHFFCKNADFGAFFIEDEEMAGTLLMVLKCTVCNNRKSVVSIKI